MKKKIWFAAGVIGACALLSFVSIDAVHAVTSAVSLSNVSTNKSGEGATNATWTATMVVNTAIPAESDLTFGFMGSAPMDQGFNFTNATVTISGTAGESFNMTNSPYMSPDRVNFRPSGAMPTGTKTVTITGVQNPTFTGLYTLSIEVRLPGSEGPGEQINASAPSPVGNIAITGRVKMPDGSAASNEYGAGVNLRSENFDVNMGTGLDQNGYYAFGISSDQGTIVSGTTYYLELWSGSTPGVVSPDPVPVVYSGTMITKNVSFITASKTLQVTVKYDTGEPVTTASVWANKKSGSSHVNVDVNSSGTGQVSMSGGMWEVGLSVAWDQENQRQYDVDWAYNEAPRAIEFIQDSTTEVQSLTFIVQKTNARIRGTVYYYDDNNVQQLLPGGFVDIRAGDRGGAGTGINNQGPDKGTFTANIMAGDYVLMVNPDTWQNPDMAQYYADEIKLRISENETKTLTIIMKKKTSNIVVTVKDKDGNLVEGAWVNAWKEEGGNGWSNGQTGADGKATLWVSSGRWGYNLDQGRRDENQTVTYIAANTERTSVDIAENSTQNVTLTVQVADATVNMKMVNRDGSAITEFFGYAWCRVKGGGYGPGSEFGSGVDRGTASIPLLGGATYTCGTQLPPEANMSLLAEVEVTIDVNQAKDVKLTLAENDSAIIGWIKDQNGKVITSSGDLGTGKGSGIGEVFAVTVGDWQWRPGQLNADGSFRISMLGGTDEKYMVGFHPWSKDGSEYMESNPEPESSFSVPANSEITKVVTVYRADTYVQGTVYAPDGKTPMPFVWVGADNWKSLEGKLKGDFEGGQTIHAGTETRGDGTYMLRLISGDFTIHSGMPPELQGDYMNPEEVDVSVSASSPATVNLVYRQADAFITAYPVFEDGTKPEYGWCFAWSEKGGHSGRDAMGGEARIPVTSGGGSEAYWVGCDTFNPETNKFFRAQEQMITVNEGDEKTVSLTLTEASFMIPEAINQTFTATQQNNFMMPDGTTVSLPANAAGSDESTYTFMATPQTALFHTADTKIPTYGWDFSITKVDSSGNQELVETLNSSATICIPVPAAVIDELGLTAQELFPKTYNEQSGAWQAMTGTTVSLNDDGSATGCAQVDHFTEFAMTTGTTIGAAAGGGPAYVVATPASGGGPQVTIWNSEGEAQLNFFAYASTLRIGIQSMAGDVDGDGENEIIVAPGPGAGPQIRVFSLSGDLESQFFAFGTHLRTGYNLAVADVNGDGIDDIIVTTMAGAGPQVRIFDGSGNVISQFFAYAESFRGGVNLATGDVDGDGVEEIITIPRENSAPHVRVFDYDGSSVSQFFAYASTIRGSFHLATGDVDADGTADIVVTPGPGLGPQVAMFTGSGELIGRFFAYATTFRGGMHASVGDVDGDGENEIVASPESNAGPHIRVFSTSGEAETSFFAYAQNLRGSFSSLVADVNEDGTADIVTAPGAGMGPHVRAFNAEGEPVAQFFTHHTGFRGGLNISSVPVF